MNENKDIPLTIKIEHHSIFGGKSIVVLNFTSLKDKKFKIGLRFIKDDNKKIPLNALVDSLKNSIDRADTANLILMDGAGMLRFIESLNLKKLENRDIADLECLDISNGTVKFSINENGNSCHKYLLSFFSLTKPNESNKDIHFGYEIPLKNDTDKKPYDVAYFFSRTGIQECPRQVIRKIYLFPIDKESLEIAQREISLCKDIEDITKLKLQIACVIFDPNGIRKLGYRDEIQTKLDIQTIILETLIHLKASNFFRKNNSKKIEIFNALANDIATDELFEKTYETLNRRDIWETLSQHRDPWGFLSFFKGKTHSVASLELIEQKIILFKKKLKNESTVQPDQSTRPDR
jgi:hypothetical protein